MSPGIYFFTFMTKNSLDAKIISFGAWVPHNEGEKQPVHCLLVKKKLQIKTLY